MTEAAIKKLGFTKVETGEDTYFYGLSVADQEFISVGNDQLVEGKWYVDFICPQSDKPSIRVYSSSELKNLINILRRNKI
jgi:hypothetical protein|tara:strand:- start:295 stop:534 length:240 start_codon:yes stop_codon:yes gene_type:complete